MSGLFDEIQSAVRSLGKSRAYAAIAIVSLALGIGANTAVFSVVHAVLLRPLAFPRPERIVAIEERDSEGRPDNTSWATAVDWRARNHSLSDLAAVSYWNPKLSGQGFEPEKVEGLRVSDGFFRVLGIAPALGRDFLPSEDRQGAPRVAILSHGLWVRRFGGDPGLVGRSVSISDVPYTVVGILPAGFESIFSTSNYPPAEVWSPLRYDATLPWACRTCRHLRAFGRLKDGISLERARAELDVVSRALVAEHPQDYPSAGVLMAPLAKRLTGDVRPVLWALLGAVGFVLLIACANVGSLLLARAATRRREVAIRVALGAGRGRIARLFLVEALLLASAGGALGVVGASWVLQTFVHAAPTRIPRLASAAVDLPVLFFALGASLATGLLFGVGPALSMSRQDPHEAIKEGSGAGRRRSIRAMGFLVTFDAAVAFLLLFGAGLLVRSTASLLRVDPGFRAEQVLKLEVDLAGPRYQKNDPVVAYFGRVLERVRSLPGVRAAGIVSQLPLGGNRDGYGIHFGATQTGNPELDPSAERFGVSPGYLAAMGIPLVSGREFMDADREAAPPVALVNETFARRAWPGAGPIGRIIRVGGPNRPPKTIVGVVGDVKHVALGASPGWQVYVPAAQWPDSSAIVVLRAVGDPSSLAGAAQAAVKSVDPAQPVSGVSTMEAVVENSAATYRFAMDLLAGFAALAVLLAAVGIYGVVSGFVGRRAREIGIRMALGAGRWAILSLVTRRAISLTAAGLFIGVLSALVLGRGLASLLFEVGPADPAALAFGTAVVLIVTAGASLIPARRATRVDPLVCLREE